MSGIAIGLDLATQRRDALEARMIESAAAAFELFGVYLGDRLGFYEALARHGVMTSSQLAQRARADERYVREWLEQQAVAGILEVETPDAPAKERRYLLPPGHDEVLADRDSLHYTAPLAQLAAAAVYPVGWLAEAFRTGDGVPFRAYGRDMREGQARMNRAMFLQQLGREWLPAVPGLDERLRSAPPARIADIGCGAGWSSIGMARAYPAVRVDGFDLDPPSIELARANADEAGLGERVQFHVRDAGDADLAGRYDLVVALECIHDMSNPVAALAAMRRLARQGGFVVVVDERAAESFSPDAGLLERLLYGFSILHCLPAGRCEQPSAATGTVMRPETLRQYAAQAGFREVEVLPIDHFLFRFYWLKQ